MLGPALLQSPSAACAKFFMLMERGSLVVDREGRLGVLARHAVRHVQRVRAALRHVDRPGGRPADLVEADVLAVRALGALDRVVQGGRAAAASASPRPASGSSTGSSERARGLLRLRGLLDLVGRTRRRPGLVLLACRCRRPSCSAAPMPMSTTATTATAAISSALVFGPPRPGPPLLPPPPPCRRTRAARSAHRRASVSGAAYCAFGWPYCLLGCRAAAGPAGRTPAAAGPARTGARRPPAPGCTTFWALPGCAAGPG